MNLLAALFNPFHTLAAWLVGLLPPGAGQLATGSAALLGIVLAGLALLIPLCALGAYLEHRSPTHEHH